MVMLLLHPLGPEGRFLIEAPAVKLASRDEVSAP
jgi:hypothetical protein